MKSFDFLKENIVDDAATMHQDHEVQMARKECYHAAEHAIAIHQLLRTVSESTGLEGWISSKITLANDYLNTVREHLEYNLLQSDTDNLTDKLDAIAIAESKKCNHTAEGKECPVHGLKECGTMYRESKSAKPDYLDFDKDGNKKESMKSALKSKKKLATKQDLAEMDKSSSQPGRDGRVSHKTYGSRGDEDPGTGPEQVVKPVKATDVAKDAEKTLTKAFRAHKKKGVGEASDISGLLAAAHLNKSFIITAKTAEGQTKKFRVKAMSEKVAIEKFKIHYSMAKILDVTEEGVAEGSLNEVSKKMLGRYVNKARDDLGSAINHSYRDYEDDEADEKDNRRAEKRQRGIDLARAKTNKSGKSSGTTSKIRATEGVAEGSEQQFMIYFVVPEHDDYPDRHEPTEQTIVDANSPGEAARKFKAETPEAYIKDIVAMKQGVAEGSTCNKTMEGESCPVHGLKECPMQENKKLKETTAGSVAGVNNPPGKNSGKKKSQIGSLFGGTYKQPVNETEFAGEKTTPPQKPGDQVRGTEKATKKDKQQPFYHRLVGNE